LNFVTLLLKKQKTQSLKEYQFNKKIAILGGGQLGKMLLQSGSKLGLDISIMDTDKTFPAASISPNFVCGDIRNYEDVLHFGMEADIITIEIENVHLEALEELERRGKKVYPQPAVLKMIRDKGLQKMFYEGNHFPSSDFSLYKDKTEILEGVREGNIKIPFVQKLRTDGYDGRGVCVVRSIKDVQNLLEGPSLVEDLVDIDKEIAVIVAKNSSGDLKVFPAVEMQFHPTANLVEFLFCPSSIDAKTAEIVEQLASDIAKSFDIIGLLAVEMFVDSKGKVWVNEVAPRPHNSGHHTIEANITSQYEMHLRAILDIPLGSTDIIRPAVMVNLLGEPGYSGDAVYENIESCLALDGVYPHIYGKKETRPYRKMGHVTVVNKLLTEAIEKARFVQKTLKVIS